MQHTICIDNLSTHVYVAELCKVFEKYGNILSARIEFNKTPSSLHVGYISFDNPSSAQFAAKEMNGKKILGRPMYVKLDLTLEENPKAIYTKIFIKNFDTNWDECDLMKIFSKFGDVKDAKVYESNGKSRGSGFVKFANHSSANAAIQAMHNQLMNDKKLIVEPYVHNDVKSHPASTLENAKELLEKSVQLNNLHVKNLPKDTTDEELRNLFQPFGKIESVKIARDGRQMSKGFGFVCFTNAKDAGLAREKINKCSYNSKILEVNFNQKKEARQQYLHMINTDEKIRKFTHEQEDLPLRSSSKNTVMSFSAKRK